MEKTMTDKLIIFITSSMNNMKWMYKNRFIRNIIIRREIRKFRKELLNELKSTGSYSPKFIVDMCNMKYISEIHGFTEHDPTIIISSLNEGDFSVTYARAGKIIIDIELNSTSNIQIEFKSYYSMEDESTSISWYIYPRDPNSSTASMNYTKTVKNIEREKKSNSTQMVDILYSQAYDILYNRFIMLIEDICDGIKESYLKKEK